MAVEPIAIFRPDRADVLTQLRKLWELASVWMQEHSGDIIVATIAGILFYLAIRSVRRVVRRAAANRTDSVGLTPIILRVLARTRNLFIIIAAARLVIGFSDPPQIVATPVIIAFIIACAVQIAIWTHEAVMATVYQRAAIAGHESLGSATTLINILVSTALILIAGIIILDNIGVNVTGLIAGLGIGGIAIGLAAKGVFEDLFAAIAIIFDSPFRVGDTVGFGQTTATVERIGLKSTRLRSLTGEEVIMSNTNLLGMELRNFVAMPKRRFRLDFSVTFETPRDRLSAIPEMVAGLVADAGHDLVRCGIAAFGTSGIDHELVFDIAAEDHATAFMARHDLALSIMIAFAEAGINFAYPTQVTYTADPDGTLISPWPPAGNASG